MSKLPVGLAIAASPTKSMWTEIPREQLPYWNDRLLQSNAPLQQYPFWNEPYERLFLTPRHLAWGGPGNASAYACVLTVGFRGFRIGLVFRGPVSLVESQPVPAEAIAGLSKWAAREGYVFLRLSPPDESTFATAASTPAAACEDFFPFYLDDGDTSPELVVEQQDSDDAMLNSFDREARRKIRRALESGCEIRISDSEQALAELWPLYSQCVARKQFRQERPLSFYAEMVRAARCHDAVRVYSAWRNGKPCAMALVVRDRDTAHCPIAAQDAESAGCSISTLLHWAAMRDMHKLGTRFYNLGQAPGSLARFKQQFSPRAVSCPGVVSLIVDGPRFELWQKVLLPLAKSVRPTVRKMSGKFYQKNSKLVIPALTEPSAARYPSATRISRSA